MDEKIWMRMGDGGEYEDFDSPFDAGDRIGIFFSEDSKMPIVSKHGAYGVEVEPHFPGPYNYVSLFWGDDDAQPIRGLTADELAQFKSGIAEGADIQVVTRTKPTKKKSKRKSKSRGRAGGAGMLRMN